MRRLATLALTALCTLTLALMANGVLAGVAACASGEIACR
jgi:hypothetical protein